MAIEPEFLHKIVQDLGRVVRSVVENLDLEFFLGPLNRGDRVQESGDDIPLVEYWELYGYNWMVFQLYGFLSLVFE